MEQYKQYIKIGLIILLAGTFINMPYGYYQAVRIFGTIGFALLAYESHQNKSTLFATVFAVAAILMNPIIKITFTREVWLWIDILFIVIVIVSMYKRK